MRNSLRRGSNPHTSTTPASVKSGSENVPSTPLGASHIRSTKRPIAGISHAAKRNESNTIARSGTEGGATIAPKKPSVARSGRMLLETRYHIDKLQRGSTHWGAHEDVFVCTRGI